MATTLPVCVEEDPEWIALKGRIDGLQSERAPVEVFGTMCEMCEANAATLYCDQDKAHLCVSCDESHHSSSKLLMRHVRLPIYHSPFQFGYCQVHSGDRYECVCLECGELLCSLCLLVGSHCELSNHPIVSTVEAFRLSLSHGGETCAFDGVFNAVFYKKKDWTAELLKMHSLVVQAESNHWNIQQMLDTELRKTMMLLSEKRKKRIDFLHGKRRECLLLLTVVEWVESFAVHARLALPASVWLSFFHRFPELVSRLVLSESTEFVEESVTKYIRTNLPGWVCTEVQILGSMEVFTGDVDLQKLGAAVATSKNTHTFEWTDIQQGETHIVGSPQSFRKNRMVTRVDEFLNNKPAPRVELDFPQHVVYPALVPLENVKDFVFQTLAVLAESESQIQQFSVPVSDVSPPGVQMEPALGGGVFVQNNLGLPEPTQMHVAGPPEEQSPTELRVVLATGPIPFGNAVALISAAPNADKPDLVCWCMYLFENEDRENFIQALCEHAVKTIDSPQFLVSSVSILVPLTAAFMLFLYPKDATILDPQLRLVVHRVLNEQPDAKLAERVVNQYIATLSSDETVFPYSMKFLLATIYNSAIKRFPQHVAIGIVSGLFLSRIVSPRLVWAAPKTTGESTTAPIVSLMTRYIHRIAGSAAEGNSVLRGEKNSMNACISQVNGMIMKTMINVEPTRCPACIGSLTPKTAAERIEAKVKQYGKGIVIY